MAARARQRMLEEALKSYRDSVVVFERLAKAAPTNSVAQLDLQMAVARIGGLVYEFILTREFARALEVADEVIGRAPEKAWLHAYRANALMFLGRVDDVRAIYLRYRGARLGDKWWLGEKSW